MIKFTGLNYKKGSGAYYLFGHFNGDGSGEEMDSLQFSYNFGNGFGDGYNFGNEIGGGESYSYKSLKEGFQNHD